jgi:hypothetical protein
MSLMRRLGEISKTAWKRKTAIVLILACGGYFAYTRVALMIMESKCSITKHSWKQVPIAGIIVEVGVQNKTNETQVVSILTEVLSVDKKVLLSKPENIILGPNSWRSAEIHITEASYADRDFYKDCVPRIIGIR